MTSRLTYLRSRGGLGILELEGYFLERREHRGESVVPVSRPVDHLVVVERDDEGALRANKVGLVGEAAGDVDGEGVVEHDDLGVGGVDEDRRLRRNGANHEPPRLGELLEHCLGGFRLEAVAPVEGALLGEDILHGILVIVLGEASLESLDELGGESLSFRDGDGVRDGWWDGDAHVVVWFGGRRKEWRCEIWGESRGVGGCERGACVEVATVDDDEGAKSSQVNMKHRKINSSNVIFENYRVMSLRLGSVVLEVQRINE